MDRRRIAVSWDEGGCVTYFWLLFVLSKPALLQYGTFGPGPLLSSREFIRAIWNAIDSTGVTCRLAPLDYLKRISWFAYILKASAIPGLCEPLDTMKDHVITGAIVQTAAFGNQCVPVPQTINNNPPMVGRTGIHNTFSQCTMENAYIPQ